jgi:ubiquinone/menaquinone biosynthesis C-methylase UbiE
MTVSTSRQALWRSLGPQLGEMAWHLTHADPGIHDMSRQHGAAMIALIERHHLNEGLRRPLRILEVGAYCHYGAHLAAGRFSGMAVTHDIAPASLELGMKLSAQLAARPVETRAVVGDFHDLPFCDDYFDLVFIASAVHHTFSVRKVIAELLRVARPGGVVHLQNEPVMRAFCTYSFRSNRQESFSPFEAAIAARGLIHTLSSPFPGSRTEELFNMVENDRIPLPVFKTALQKGADLLDWRVDTAGLIGEPEEKLLALRRDDTLEDAIGDWILDEVAALRPNFSAADGLCGRRLPGPDDVWSLAYRTAEGLRRMAACPDDPDIPAQLFGAALRASVRKCGVGAGAGALLRRPLSGAGAVETDPPNASGAGIQLANILPDPTDSAAISGFFPASDWTIITEDNGYTSICNQGGVSRILTGDLPGRAVVLLRIYSVAADHPYRVSIAVDGADVHTHAVTTSESHLARMVLTPGAVVEVSHGDLEGRRVELPWHTRLIARGYRLLD